MFIRSDKNTFNRLLDINLSFRAEIEMAWHSPSMEFFSWRKPLVHHLLSELAMRRTPCYSFFKRFISSQNRLETFKSKTEKSSVFFKLIYSSTTQNFDKPSVNC